MTEDQNTTTTSTSMTVDNVVGVSDREHPIMEAGQPHETGENTFMVDAPKTRSGRVCCARDFAMLSVCTCGESVSDEEVAAYRDIIQCKKAGCETKWVSTSMAVTLNILTD
jgi:hypothetical protein